MTSPMVLFLLDRLEKRQQLQLLSSDFPSGLPHGFPGCAFAAPSYCRAKSCDVTISCDSRGTVR